MNPLVQDIAFSLMRKALTSVAAVLVTNGWLNEGQTEQLIVGAGLLLASIAWSVWQRYKDRVLLLIGLGLPASSSIGDALQVYNTPNVENPSATLPTDAPTPMMPKVEVPPAPMTQKH